MRLLQRSPEVLTADFPQAKVIFDLETYTPYTLNHSAALLWDFLRQPRKERGLAAFLEKRYAISSRQARKDAGRFIKDLKKRGLLCLKVKIK